MLVETVSSPLVEFGGRNFAHGYSRHYLAIYGYCFKDTEKAKWKMCNFRYLIFEGLRLSISPD